MIHPASRLREIEQRARRRFGQNFLASPDAVDRIVAAASLAPGDRVLEIGPGLGVLTEKLRASGAEVRCVELDRDLAEALHQLWPDLRLLQADAMKVDFPAFCEGSGWKVVANLPYNVASPLVLRLLDHPGTFMAMTLMFQREVAERIRAGADDSARGSLSVQVQARAEVRPVLELPPGAFFPAPKVHSSVLGFRLRPVPVTGGVDPRRFDAVVRAGFQHRRKTLLNSLGGSWERSVVEAVCVAAGVDSRRRAETLTLEEWGRVAAALELHRSVAP